MTYRYKLLDSKLKNFMEHYRKEFPESGRFAGFMAKRLRFTKKETKLLLKEYKKH